MRVCCHVTPPDPLVGSEITGVTGGRRRAGAHRRCPPSRTDPNFPRTDNELAQSTRLLWPHSSTTTHVPVGSPSGRRGRVHLLDEPDILQQRLQEILQMGISNSLAKCS